MEQLARLKDADRRTLLHSLSDAEYSDLIRVLGAMPFVEMGVKYEVVDDDETTVIVTNSIITV